jgi:hypothetical protein
MNWYKKAENLFKISSVTISPADSGKVYQPMNLLDLHFSLDAALRPEGQRAFDSVGGNKDKYWAAAGGLFASSGGHPDAYESTDPNEDSGPFASTGNIRLISYPPIDPDHVSELIDKWVDHWELVDDFSITWAKGPIQGERFNIEWLKEHGINPDSGTEWIITVYKNPSVNVAMIPELNLANSNWGVLHDLLFPERSREGADWYAGSISIENLERRIQTAEGIFESTPDAYSSKPSDSHNLEIPENATPEERKRLISEQAQNRKRMRIHDFGLSPDRIRQYFKELESIIAYCKKHKVNEISWG